MLLFFSPPSGNQIIDFVLEHAPEKSHYMTIHDIAAPGFLYIIGLSMPLSFWSRVNKRSLKNAIIMASIRCIIFIGVGLAVSVAIGPYPLTMTVYRDEYDITIIRWNLATSIGNECIYCISIYFNS